MKQYGYKYVYTVIIYLFLSVSAVAQNWPSLPERDATVDIPAQEWPRQPGPRTAKVYVWYPGGAITNVNADTGLMLNLHNWCGTKISGAMEPSKLVDAITDLNRTRGVIIHVIVFGTQEAKKFMELASRNGGQCVIRAWVPE